MTVTWDPKTVAGDFAGRMALVFERDLHRAEAAELATSIGAALAEEGPSSKTGRRLLRESGVRDTWNRVFAEQRSAAVAAAIRPHVRGRVVDLLAGDATVAAALRELGCRDISCWERRGAYPEPPRLPVSPFEELLTVRPAADTVLMVTVLHHEKSAPELLDQARELGARRWVVVENCVSETVSDHLHEFADIFFNTCLNEFDVDCTTEHRTLEAWCELLGGHGTVAHAGDLGRVPGMPFPYELIVVDL